MTPTVQSTRQLGWRVAFLAVCAFVFVWKVLRGFPGNMWDFRVYYYAAEAWANGVNPYVLGNLPQALDQGFFAFTYPPYLLPLFWPLTLLPLQTATLVFLAIKLILLAWLVVIWSDVLRISVAAPSWILFLLFGYSSAIFVDVASGNVVVIEQLIAWLGIASLLRQQYGRFVTAVVAASLFKLTPIILLALCWWIPNRRRYKYLAGGVLSFVGILLATYLASPRLTTEFLQHVMSLDERGPNNAALLPLIRDVSQHLSQASGFAINAGAQTALYALLASAVLLVTWMAANRAAGTHLPNRLEEIVHLVVLGSAVAAPRMKLYAYILVLASTYYAAMSANRVPAALPLLLIACLTVNNWMLRPEQLLLIASYWSWLVALGFWVLLVDRNLRAHARVSAPGAMTSVNATSESHTHSAIGIAGDAPGGIAKRQPTWTATKASSATPDR